MRRMIFAAAAGTLMAGRLAAQQVPGRDLLEFPVGAVVEPEALSSDAPGAFWNPAMAPLPSGARFKVGAAALTGPADQAVSIQLVGGVATLPGDVTAFFSAARGSVGDIVRTTSDPQSVGGDVPYHTTLVSLGVARRTHRQVTAGLSVRYRVGQLDGRRADAVGIDGGAVAHGLFGRDGRVAASSFLWTPAQQSEERPTYNFAGDFRAAGRDERNQVRLGYAFSRTSGAGREHYVFGTGRSRAFEARAGVARLDRFERPDWRLRLGVGVYYARYSLGIGREESGAGLAATYQFTLSTIVKR